MPAAECRQLGLGPARGLGPPAPDRARLARPARWVAAALSTFSATEQRSEHAADDVLARPARSRPCRRSGSAVSMGPARLAAPPRDRPSPAPCARARPAAVWAAAMLLRLPLAISRCCWAGVIVFMPGRRRRVDTGPHRRLGRSLGGGRLRGRDPRGDPLVRAVAVDRSRRTSRRTGSSRCGPGTGPRRVAPSANPAAAAGSRASGVGTPRGDSTVTSASPVPSDVMVFSTS